MVIQQPPDPLAYRAAVWLIVKQVPYGQVTTYGQIASMIPVPPGVDPEVYRRIAPRWVGEAMTTAYSEDQIDGTHTEGVPWQRVINSQGGIAMRKGGSGYTRQRELLIAEGIAFDSRDRVDFNTVGWDGPPEEFLTEHGLKPPKSLKKKPKEDDGPIQLSLF